MDITESSFGGSAKLYTLENDQGVRLSVTNFGARIVRLQVPINGVYRDLVLGFDSMAEYLEKDHFMGATIGRVAGRIAAGRFNIDGKKYQTPLNENGNTLHGGPDSFETKLWQSQKNITDELIAVTFTYNSPAQENDFPGSVTVEVTYSLDNANGWGVDYKAHSDVATLFNPTNHVYFNLDGDPSKSVGNHSLQIDAHQFAPLDQHHLTTGLQQTVNDSTFDFRKPKKIAEVFTTDNPQNQLVNGLDHPFFLDKKHNNQVVAKLTSSDGLVAVNLTTSSPAVVIFTANFGTDFSLPMRRGLFKNHGGITLETQVAPGAERYPEFGNIILDSNLQYHERTLFGLDF
jgi:aldose 1-epimerase